MDEGTVFPSKVIDDLVRVAQMRLVSRTLLNVSDALQNRTEAGADPMFARGWQILHEAGGYQTDAAHRTQGETLPGTTLPPPGESLAKTLADKWPALCDRAMAFHDAKYGARTSRQAEIHQGLLSQGPRLLGWSRAFTGRSDLAGTRSAMDNLLSGRMRQYPGGPTPSAGDGGADLRDDPKATAWVEQAATEAAAATVRPTKDLYYGLQMNVEVLGAVAEAWQLTIEAGQRGRRLTEAQAFHGVQAVAKQRDHYFNLWRASYTEPYEGLAVDRLEARLVADGHDDKRGVARRQARETWGPLAIPQAATAGLGTVSKNLTGVKADAAAAEEQTGGVNVEAGRPVSHEAALAGGRPPEGTLIAPGSARPGDGRPPSPEQIDAIGRDLELRQGRR